MATLNGRSSPVITDILVAGDEATLRVDWERDGANWLTLTLTRAELLALLFAMANPDATIDLTADGIICVG